MNIKKLLWLSSILDKIERKHGVHRAEVCEVLQAHPRIRFVEAGLHDGEDVYAALGRTDAGRFLIVFFILKADSQAIIISARDMTAGEKPRYAKK